VVERALSCSGFACLNREINNYSTKENTMSELIMMAVGDIILDTPKPAEQFFELVKPVLAQSDLAVGQCEVLYTSRGIPTFIDPRYPSTPSPISSISALQYAGFDVMTMAGNHAWDAGVPGIEDTINALDEYGIAHTGAGMNLDEAHEPAVVERNGIKFGFLSYNCVGPVGSWASDIKPGCAYVKIDTVYESGFPACPPSIKSYPDRETLARMEEEIRALRPQVDVLVVALHKGIGFLPVRLADYEFTVSHAAIDAGADLIIGHHAHILKGVEIYKGKYILHGLGHFTNVLDHGMGKDKAPEEAAKFMYNFKCDHGGPFFLNADATEVPFPISDENGVPIENLSMIVKAHVKDKKITRVSCLPVLIRKDGKPEVQTADSEYGQKIFNFVRNSTTGAFLNAKFAWDGDEIVIYE